jgi:N-acetylmuramoyl-L-alanine amidase
MRQINKIIVHCSATREGQDISVDTIRKWHVEGRGWSDIGYHFYIDVHGNIHKGRDIAKIGAHCKGQKRKSIGICDAGGGEGDGKTP